MRVWRFFSVRTVAVLAALLLALPAVGQYRAGAEVSAVFDRALADWQRFERGEADAAATAKSLASSLQRSKALVASLETTGPVAPAPGRAALLDVARAVSDLLSILVTVGQFHTAFGPQTTKIGEATDQLLIAKRLISEIEAIRSRPLGQGWPEAAPDLSSDRQYVFVILLDTLRADHVGAYGYRRDTTPNIDRLAREGVLVERAISQASLTNTSVASMITGLYPGSHKMLGKADWLSEKSLVAELRDGGYTTGGFSANPIVTKSERFDYGYDQFEELTWCRAEVVVGEALRWFDRRRVEREKIFTYLHLMDPHDLYFPPPDYLEKYSGQSSFRVAAYWLDWMIENELAAKGSAFPECGFDPAIENWGEPERLLACLSKLEHGVKVGVGDIQNMVDRYDGEIRYADSQIGQLVEYLRKVGVLEDSTIVIVSDHGEAFLEHNRLRHGRELYQTQIHVPLIVWKGDGSLTPRRVSSAVELIDVMPTLFSLIGLKVQADVQGRDFLAATAAGSRATYSMTWNGREILTDRRLEIHSVLESDWKYIRTTDPASGATVREELYHLASDPSEVRDVRGVESTNYERLRQRLSDWLKETDVPAPAALGAPLSEAQKERLRALGYIK